MKLKVIVFSFERFSPHQGYRTRSAKVTRFIKLHSLTSLDDGLGVKACTKNNLILPQLWRALLIRLGGHTRALKALKRR